MSFSSIALIIAACVFGGLVLSGIVNAVTGKARRRHDDSLEDPAEPLPSMSGFAIVGFLFALLSLLPAFASWLLIYIGENADMLNIDISDRGALALSAQITAGAAMLPAIVGAILALIGWLSIGESKGKLRGRGLCMVVLLVATLVGVYGFAGEGSIQHRAHEMTSEAVEVEQRMLGVNVIREDKKSLKKLGIPKGEGALRVTEVISDSAAERAGIQKGDRIIGFAGKPLPYKGTRTALVRQLQEVHEAEVELLRDGRRETVTASWVEDLPRSGGAEDKGMTPAPPVPPKPPEKPEPPEEY